MCKHCVILLLCYIGIHKHYIILLCSYIGICVHINWLGYLGRVLFDVWTVCCMTRLCEHFHFRELCNFISHKSIHLTEIHEHYFAWDDLILIVCVWSRPWCIIPHYHVLHNYNFYFISGEAVHWMRNMNYISINLDFIEIKINFTLNLQNH